MAITGRFQRIGDLAAGTMVIVDRARRPPWDLQPDDPRAFGLAELIPPAFVANYTMTQTIGMYMESRRKLPMARRIEVARHLAVPLMKKFEMLPDTSPDLLLSALFVRIYMSEQQQAAGRDQLRQAQSKNGSKVPTSTIPVAPTKLAMQSVSKTALDSTSVPIEEEVEIVASIVTPQELVATTETESLPGPASRTEERL